MGDTVARFPNRPVIAHCPKNQWGRAHGRLANYFAFYNHERLHQALDYQTPAEVYFAGGETRP